MEENRALVIGSSGGLGAALVRQLRQQGWRVHGLSRRTGLDLEQEGSIAAAAAPFSEGPPLDLVLVATGVLHGAFSPERALREVDPEHLLRDYRINAVGPALIAKHFLPKVARDRRAVFAALSARVGSIGDNRLGGWHSYRASKAALNMLLRTIAIEAARTHPALIVAGLHPGTVDTGLSAPFRRGVKPGVLLTPDASAASLLSVIDELTPKDSGGVFAWDGSRLPE